MRTSRYGLAQRGQREQRMHYQEVPAPARLRRYVQCLWWLRIDAPAGGTQLIYPDGRCELIAHLGTPMRARSGNGRWRAQPRALFAAQQLEAIRLRAAGPVNTIGLRLQPALSGAIPARGAVPRDVAAPPGSIADLACIDRELARDWLAVAARVVHTAAPTGELQWDAVEALWDQVADWLPHYPVDAGVEQAVGRIDAAAGDCRIADVAAATGCSLRSLQARFGREVGMAPKAYARIRRLQAMIAALDPAAPVTLPLASLAADRGFSDQAHATRALRAVTGVTPARLRAALAHSREDASTIALAAAFVRGSASA